MKILIVGLSKTGTTGLFYKVKNSIHGPVLTLFQPSHCHEEMRETTLPVITKILLDRTDLLERFSFFDYKIGIVRDPRDTVISRMLYRAGFHGSYIDDPRKVDRMLQLLMLKENDNRRVSVLDILRLHCALTNYSETLDSIWAAEIRLLNKIQWRVIDAPGIFKIKYEDFVCDRLDDLEIYLGFPLTGSAEVDPKLKRVGRTKASGDWKNWFLEEDVEFFRPLYQAFLSRNGYDLGWERHRNQRVLPTYSSRYFARLISERRQLQSSFDMQS